MIAAEQQLGIRPPARRSRYRRTRDRIRSRAHRARRTPPCGTLARAKLAREGPRRPERSEDAGRDRDAARPGEHLHVYATGSHTPDAVVIDNTTLYRIVQDHLGSVRLVLKASDGTRAQRTDYDAWGKIDATTQYGAGFQAFGYAGGLPDADTGLVQMGARWYDPVVGRWISKDPILFGGGLNLYAYVENDPVNFIDPWGLTKYDKLWGLPKKFWKWFHRQSKRPGDPDLSKDEAKELYDEWLGLGKPGPDNKGRHCPVDEDDFLDLIPLPPIPSCILNFTCFSPFGPPDA